MKDMPATDSPPLAFVQLLTGQDHRPGALLWHCEHPDPVELLPWLQQPSWPVLCAALPCVWPPEPVSGWAPELRQAMTAAQMQVLQAPCPVWAPGEPWPEGAVWASGSWYTAPPSKPNVAQAASRQRALQLLQMVAQDADTHELEDVFRHDAALSYQLLRLVNSVAVGSRREITSFGQAILMLGRQQLKRWLNLLLFAARDDDERSAMLMVHVSLRARGMELLAQACGQDRAAQDQAFMAGMFSMLGVLFGQPLPDMLRTLQVSDALHAALLDRSGELGGWLAAWEAIEQGEAATVLGHLQPMGLSPAQYHSALLDACLWTLQLTRGTPGHGAAG